MSAARGWLIPVAVAVAVLVGVLGAHALMTGRGGGVGPDEDRRVVEDPQPPLPTVREAVTDLPRGSVRMVGYQSLGRQLMIAYRVFDLSCTQLPVQPEVSESIDSVVLTLRRAPADEQQLVACPTEPYLDLVYVDLSSTLRGRAVVDAVSGRRLPVFSPRN